MALQKKIENDDLLTRMRIREVLLIGLITMTAVLANLPQESLERPRRQPRLPARGARLR